MCQPRDSINSNGTDQLFSGVSMCETRVVSAEWEIWLTTCMYMCTCLLHVLYILCNTPVNIIRTQYTHCTKMNFVQGRLILSYTYKHTVQHNVHVVVSQN